ncbi:iron chaperone [Amphibacillus jilinensis]|uniref:iron chaperone n=1 Tax=Amphibacillus jilinensis TaxID=1216008 RepID=UPI0003194818|nr:iron chaperone [Amphibacillus jilinensis]
MSELQAFIESIEDDSHRERIEEVLNWVKHKYPNLKIEIKWKQPMFTDHGTFIIGFSVAKKHLAVAPEEVAIQYVEEDLKTAGYSYTKQLIRMPWETEIDYPLLEKIIAFNISDKADCSSFWRR